MIGLNRAYERKLVDRIVVREFVFKFPRDLNPVWCPGNRARSHLFNGMSLVLPYLEPYLIKSTRAAIPYIKAPELLEDMQAFCGQEARHYKCHRELNDMLKANGYPELANVERRIASYFKRLTAKPLRAQLAFNAGFECMTNGLTNWAIKKRSQLFLGASPDFVSFWLMHAVEEAEHKTVAFDVYMSYSGKYFPRAIGVLRGSLCVLGLAFAGMITALNKDKQFRHPSGVLDFFREVGSFLAYVTPYSLRALLPWHNPRNEEDPQWMKDWIRGHASHPEGQLLPLVDTSTTDMLVPFATPRDDWSPGSVNRRKAERRKKEVDNVLAVLGFPDRRRGDRRAVDRFQHAAG